MQSKLNTITVLIIIVALLHNSIANPFSQEPQQTNLGTFLAENDDQDEGIVISSKILNSNATNEQFPEAPQNLTLKLLEDEDILLLQWELESKTHTGFQVHLEMLDKPFEISYNEDTQNALERRKSMSFFTEEKSFKRSLKSLKLIPGMSYKATVFTQNQAKLSQEGAATNFTLKPSPPVRFVVWYRNETSFLVVWQPPTNGVFDRYKTEISPRESPTSTLLVSHKDYQFGGVRPGFFQLTPGKAYDIMVLTQSGEMSSDPLIKEYRTMPMKPQNLSVTILSYKIAPQTILVEWDPPTIGEYDGWNVYIKREWGKQMQTFIPRIKPPRAHLHETTLEFGNSYEVVVKSVSGKVSSYPISLNFTYTPSDYP